MIDANKYVLSTDMNEAMENVGLTEAIIARHKETYGELPTHKKGSTPIDGIFVSETIHIECGGYLPFGDGPSDHRALWIEVKESTLFGYNMEKIVPPQARKLTLEDPRVVKSGLRHTKAF